MKKILMFTLLALSFGALAACGGNNGEADNDTGNNQGEVEELDGELIVYSSRNETFVQDLLDKFTEDTGVEVRALHGAEPLQIQEEAGNVQADIFISNDIGALEYLNQQDLLEGYEPENVESIDEEYRAENNEWFAISARARGFIYNKDMIAEDEMPTKMDDLLDPEWSEVDNGYAITRGGNGGMIGNVSALRYEWGDERTSDWIMSIQENAAGILDGHGDIRRAVGAGEHAFGLVNNYYYHQQLEEPTNNNVGFIYPDQAEGEMGAIANAAGLGMVSGGPNEENAHAFIDWILEEENQLAFVGESLEVPINPDLEPPFEEAVSFSELNVQDMPLEELGNYFEDTRTIIEESGLDLELR
ncbi:iron(III) transport system substrate-binding protein [Virgibacillus natechei]|uniref:Iron(III) transport system substrate-binding protein n=1 Tax=Virgibacillus natechei TaxID=1216297 RepID=A0ABS4IDV4_9BACI|nr:extracellular solute-binding protein [Virgibacillus natechei]MBP1969124.1 iron(III) transport system substrate-binding protein [Virgibacillus natechei]UZD14389.1 extracellular solute-binding protein [Virgibacillus natechei]